MVPRWLYRWIIRNPIDIEMFGDSHIDTELFLEKLKDYGNEITTQSTKNILITKINEIKVDFVSYKNPYVMGNF